MGLLSAKDTDVRVYAAVALGESRCEQAFEPLCSCWQTEKELSVRAVLLTCIGLLRSTESQDFLVSLIHGTDVTAAADAIRSLAPYSMLDELRHQVEQAVERSSSTGLRDVFRS